MGPVGEGRFLIGAGQVDLAALPSPVLVHETRLDPVAGLPRLATNAEATVVLIPNPTLSGTVIADDLLPEDRFWKLLGNGISQLKGSALRRGLRRQSKATVVAFQARLIERCTALVDARGMSWSLAGSLLLVSRSAFERHLTGDLPAPLDIDDEFADLTDIAEDILGTRIDVPGYGDSRNGLGAAPTTRTRWLSWRTFAEREDELLEVFYFGQRPPATPMREMVPVAKEAMERDGLLLRADVETWFPDMIHRVPASYLVPYGIRRSGPEDFDAYLRENALAAP
jgi:hypothetical protein